MVRTQQHTEDLPAIERIKRLQELEREKEKELEESIKEQQQKKHEIDDAKWKIAESIKEQQQEEAEQVEEGEERDRKKRLESILGETPTPKNKGVMYGDVLEQVREGARLDMYGITNYNVVNEMERIREKAERGELSDNERHFLENVQYNMNKMEENNAYVSNQQESYVNRVEDVLRDLERKSLLR